MRELNERIEQIKKGLETIEQILPFLPRDLREKCEHLAAQLRDGLREIEILLENDRIAEAREAARRLFDLFRQKNPPREIIEQAVEISGPLISSLVPPLAFVESVARLAVRLGGRAYDLWKARVLRVPFAPAVTPLVVQDANSGFTILMRSPTFRDVFRDELAENDRRFYRKLVRRYVEKGDLEWLRTAYADRFDSDEHFQIGADEFEAAAAEIVMRHIDSELRDLVESTSTDSMVDYDTLASVIDRLRDDANGAAALDALVTLFEGLHRGGGRVLSLLDKVTEEIES